MLLLEPWVLSPCALDPEESTITVLKSTVKLSGVLNQRAKPVHPLILAWEQFLSCISSSLCYRSIILGFTRHRRPTESFADFYANNLLTWRLLKWNKQKPMLVNKLNHGCCWFFRVWVCFWVLNLSMLISLYLSHETKLFVRQTWLQKILSCATFLVWAEVKHPHFFSFIHLIQQLLCLSLSLIIVLSLCAVCCVPIHVRTHIRRRTCEVFNGQRCCQSSTIFDLWKRCKKKVTVGATASHHSWPVCAW